MSRLPRPVLDYLVDAVALDRSPAFLEVSPDGALVDWGGPLDLYGLQPLEHGRRVQEQVDALEGLLPADPSGLVLPCVAVAAGSPADIHVFRRDGCDWIVLLDASPFETRSQPPQQEANEESLDAHGRGAAVSRAGVLSAALGALDLVVLERQTGGAFAQVSEPTSWWQALFPRATPGARDLRPQDVFHFLANFLIDAEAFWVRPNDGGVLKSGPWQETAVLSDTDWLEATALSRSGRSLLVISGPRAIPPEEQTYLQSGRVKSLEAAAHVRTEERLRLDKQGLEADVRQRADELAEANRRLECELSERRATEERLRILAHSIESIAEMITITDLEDRFTFVNRAFLDCYGYAAEEVLGQHVRMVQPGPRPPEVLHEILRETRRGGWVGEVINVRKDGSTFPISLSTSQVKDASGRPVGLVGVSRDITEQKRTEEAMRQAEERYRQAQRIEAVGRLAGGVAHDFNNLLTVMNGYADIALSSLDPSDPVAADIAQVKRAGERAAALTGQLLAFSRKQVLTRTVLDLNPVVSGVARMLRHLIGEDIHLVVDLGPSPALISADVAQIEQVIMNLAVNARDAMPHGGTLTIAVADADLGADPLNRFDVPPGPYVVLTVTDTGIGMDDDTRSRIFEPFFTTKREGIGTGLGLSTVYGIVKQSGGGIVVDSRLGHGATFAVCLPRCTDWDAVSESAPAVEVPTGGHEVVLVVEDEDTVRSLVRTILVDDGYIVLDARSGDDALKLAAEHPGAIHLLLTDIVMPGMSGCDLARRLEPTRPDMKVLFMSGYPDDVTLRYQVADKGAAFLQKPFLPKVLARAVRQALDAC